MPTGPIENLHGALRLRDNSRLLIVDYNMWHFRLPHQQKDTTPAGMFSTIDSSVRPVAGGTISAATSGLLSQ